MGRSPGIQELLGRRGSCLLQLPVGAVPVTVTAWASGDGVGVCSQLSAQRAGRKRAAELAPALLTHRLVPESNHGLVFNEHLSWKAGNPLVSCFAPWLVLLAGVFSFWLLVSFHPLLSRQLFERKRVNDPKEQVSVPPLHPSQHVPAPCSSKKAFGDRDLSPASLTSCFL